MKNLDDAEAWDRAVNAVKNEFTALSDHLLKKINMLASIIKGQKLAIHELTRSVAGESVCESCQGECCNTGKYHFTVTDLLVYLSDSKAMFTPDFTNKRCPYLGQAGCIMEPEYRPFNCITFQCDSIEQLLRQPDVQKFYDLGKKLSFQYVVMEEMFNNKFIHGLLSNFARDYEKNGKILFK